jgi:hypothetical protein
MGVLAVCTRCEGRGWYWLRVHTDPDTITVVEVSCPTGCVIRSGRSGRVVR